MMRIIAELGLALAHSFSPSLLVEEEEVVERETPLVGGPGGPRRSRLSALRLPVD